MFLVVLSFLASLLLYAYFSLAQFQKSKSLPFKQQNRVLVVIAHPDDECMFFGPTITTLVSLVKCRVHVLCLSNGICFGRSE